MLPLSYSVLLFVVLLAALVIASSVKILREYERAVVFTLGRFAAVRGPGLVLLVPFVQKMVRVDMRIQVIEVPSQDVISRDNVSMKVDAVLYFKVVDPERAIIMVQNYMPATNMLAQTTMRAVLGQHDLDEMLSERKKLSTDVQEIRDTQTETWVFPMPIDIVKPFLDKPGRPVAANGVDRDRALQSSSAAGTN